MRKFIKIVLCILLAIGLAFCVYFALHALGMFVGLGVWRPWFAGLVLLFWVCLLAWAFYEIFFK